MSLSPTTQHPAVDQLDWLGEELHYKRPDLARELFNRLLRDQIVVLLGPQGGGKSTLASKDLIQLIKPKNVPAERLDDDWRVVVTRPYHAPLRNLAQDLTKPGILFEKGAKELTFQQSTEELLRQDSHGLVHLYQQTVEETEKRFNLLMVVKLKQDFYRFQDHLLNGEDDHFLKLLLTAAYTEIPVYVVFITDSENLNHFSRYRGLPEMINNYRFEVPPLSVETVRAQLLDHYGDLVLPDFLEQTLSAYQDLLDISDKFALFKFNHFLRHTYHLWRQQAVASSTEGLRQLYQERLRKRLFYSLHQQMDDNYNLLDQQPLIRQAIPFFFQALTESGMGNKVLRRPITLGALEALTRRAADARLPKDIALFIMRHFNGQGPSSFYPHSFIELAQPPDTVPTPNSIVDINFDAIPATWLRLREWIREESMHASIYLNSNNTAKEHLKTTPQKELLEDSKLIQVEEKKGTFRDWLKELARSFRSLRWNKKKEEEKQKTKEKEEEASLLFEGATLSGAVKWLKEGYPTEVWAARYPVPPQGKFSTAQLNLLKELLGETDPAKITDLAIARWFVEKSKLRDQQRTEEETASRLEQIKQANKQRRIALILAAMALVLFGVGMYFLHKARTAQNNLELLNLVEVLNLNNILKPAPGTDFSLIERIEPQIAKDKKIKSKEDVLRFLTRQGLLPIDSNETSPSYEALLTIDLLYNELQQGQIHDDGTTTPSTDELLKIYHTLPAVSAENFRQYPYVFYAFAAQQKILEQDGSRTINVSNHAKSLIEDLASNPVDPSQHAYGDRNGKVIVNKRGNDGKWKNFRDEQVNGTVSAMAYTADGEHLLVGTRGGLMYAFGGMSQSGLTQTPPEIVTLSGSISQIIPYRDNLLLVQTGRQVHLMDLQNLNGRYFSTTISDLERISHLALSNDDEQQFLVASGKDNSRVYSIDPTRSDRFLEPVVTLSHSGSSISHVTMKTYDKSIGSGSWILLGSETGDLWYAENYQDIFDPFSDVVDLSETTIFTFIKAHRSTITSIVFNKEYPQVATASLDGYMQFWNLGEMDQPNERIRLKNNGQGIWDLCYINANEVIIAENINTQVWPTTIKSQFDELNRLCSGCQ